MSREDGLFLGWFGCSPRAVVLALKSATPERLYRYGLRIKSQAL